MNTRCYRIFSLKWFPIFLLREVLSFSFHTWLHNISFYEIIKLYIFGLKKNLSHPETLSLIANVLIFARANLLSFYYWNSFNALFVFFFKWAKGIIYPQKTYSNLDANGKTNTFNKILRYVTLHFVLVICNINMPAWILRKENTLKIPLGSHTGNAKSIKLLY